jgi:hypothetical protein
MRCSKTKQGQEPSNQGNTIESFGRVEFKNYVSRLPKSEINLFADHRNLWFD